ncbi:MAG: hypothetical protein FJ164_10810 [Gammaproteobacteria bacterium]|nr:hypothetical protein [Gammaproteobacteria bacterium]
MTTSWPGHGGFRAPCPPTWRTSAQSAIPAARLGIYPCISRASSWVSSFPPRPHSPSGRGWLRLRRASPARSISSRRRTRPGCAPAASRVPRWRPCWACALPLQRGRWTPGHLAASRTPSGQAH